ncbi:hypothetical protein Gpo141_00001844 [Globisporangium polare]
MWAFEPVRPVKTFHADLLATAFKPSDAFVHAASLNQIEVVKKWIARSHDVNEPDTEGNRALCVAAQNQCLEVLELLVANGADVNLRQRDGRSALHVACTWGRQEAAEFLLGQHAKLQMRDNDGQGPLHAACRNGHGEIVRALLSAGVDPFLADEYGSTPFDLARDWQRLDIQEMLREYQTTVFREAVAEKVALLASCVASQIEIPATVFEAVLRFLC